jgi:hypothetical protein
MGVHQQRAAAERQADWEEGQRFRMSSERAIEVAREAAEAKAAVQAERRRELDSLNQSQSAFRRSQFDEERALDARYAQQAAEDLRKEEEDKLVQRLVRVRKAGPTQGLYMAQLGRTQDASEEAERCIQAAQDEVNQKEDDMRTADAARRRSLMLDAVGHRVQTMRLHDEQREDKKRQKEIERQELEADLALKRQLDQEEYETRRSRISNQYNMLASQCALKSELQQKAKQEERESAQALIQSWKDEETRIQEELAHPHALVGGKFRGHR